MWRVVKRVWRAWQANQDKRRLLAPLWRDVPEGVSEHSELQLPELRAVELAGGPDLPPYEGLADAWDEYGSLWLADYPPYLAALTRRRGAELRSVLDLACGTGLLSAPLAGLAREVVGLDASEAMLAKARTRCQTLPGVQFACGDFRSFTLGRQFDAAVCASNSLNYVTDQTELHRVFVSVSHHLRPGAPFVFDTTTEIGMQTMSGRYLQFDRCGRRFALHCSFDADQRRTTSRVILPTGIETHRRIPLDPVDVIAAAVGTDLTVDDYFCNPGMFGAVYFVLTKQG